MNNPAKYREMCVPFESVDAANEALGAFQKELRELRQKHRIRDVTFAMAVDIKSPEHQGGEFVARVTGHIGNSSIHLELSAYALGEARAEAEAGMRALEEYGRKVASERAQQ